MIYFNVDDANVTRVLQPDVPARMPDGTLCLIGGAPCGSDLQVFLEGRWTAGSIIPEPAKYTFIVEVTSFDGAASAREELDNFCMENFYGRKIRHAEVNGTVEEFIVIAREDRTANGAPGTYSLCTRQTFETRGAAAAYADGVSPSREPLIVRGKFFNLCGH